jgi:hypothetical protein
VTAVTGDEFRFSVLSMAFVMLSHCLGWSEAVLSMAFVMLSQCLGWSEAVLSMAFVMSQCLGLSEATKKHFAFVLTVCCNGDNFHEVRGSRSVRRTLG